jgi:putative oxidoreductase
MTDRSGLQSFAFAALRIVAGLMFACHGAQKLFGVWGMGGHKPEMWSQLWFGGVIELVCGILVAIGLFTRPAALLASGTMAVAYFQFNWKLAMDNNMFLPIVNKGESAVLYCFLFLMFAAFGAGAYSADGRRGRM